MRNWLSGIQNYSAFGELWAEPHLLDLAWRQPQNPPFSLPTISGSALDSLDNVFQARWAEFLKEVQPLIQNLWKLICTLGYICEWITNFPETNRTNPTRNSAVYIAPKIAKVVETNPTDPDNPNSDLTLSLSLSLGHSANLANIWRSGGIVTVEAVLLKLKQTTIASR